MIDLHSHIIFGIDDGPADIDSSLRMIEEAEKLGIRLIIATPHYQSQIFESEKVKENYWKLVNKARQYEVKIEMGYEVFFRSYEDFFKRNQKSFTLAGTEKVLIEIPFNANPVLCKQIAKTMVQNGLVPIISHPERNRNFLDRLADFVELTKSGCLIQVDAASIVGVYGLKVKEFTKKLIKMRLVDMVASNAHCAKDYSDWYMTAYNNTIRWVGQGEARKLFYYNAKELLNNSTTGAYKNVIELGEIYYDGNSIKGY